ncbi:MAG: hypothetical protein ACR2RF_14745 [Geminicoccaceae bacterium]
MATVTPVDIGTAPNDGTGDPLRTAFTKLNTNDSNINVELAGAVQSPVVTADLQDDAVTFAKMQNIPTANLIGRATAGTGDPEDLTAAQTRTLLNVEDGATADQAASEVPFTPTGNIAATDVQAAVAEVEAEKPQISTEDELAGQMELAVVAVLPGTPDANTLYFVTT